MSAAVVEGKPVAWVYPSGLQQLAKQSGPASVGVWNCPADGLVPLYLHVETKRAACDCMEKANAALAKHNTRIEQLFVLSGDNLGARWPITTVQIEKGCGKPKAMGLVASFCPLCGNKLSSTGIEA